MAGYQKYPMRYGVHLDNQREDDELSSVELQSFLAANLMLSSVLLLYADTYVHK